MKSIKNEVEIQWVDLRVWSTFDWGCSLWSDQQHGMGHGVGLFLNVHEGLPDFSSNVPPTHGHILTNELGYCKYQYIPAASSIALLQPWHTRPTDKAKEFGIQIKSVLIIHPTWYIAIQEPVVAVSATCWHIGDQPCFPKITQVFVNILYTRALAWAWAGRLLTTDFTDPSLSVTLQVYIT